MLDVHADPDHNRSVFTLAADPPEGVERAAVQLAEAVARHVDTSWRDGVHPRLGALDVVPFVALSGTPEARASAVRTAHYFAGWLADAMDVPTFLYGEAVGPAATDPTVELANRTIIARVEPRNEPEKGEKVYLKIKAGGEHCFSVKTGERLPS